MVSQYVWIGIAVGVFVAGIGIGFAHRFLETAKSFFAVDSLISKSMIIHKITDFLKFITVLSTWA